ncbi:hypothetical protein BU17DRAFT_71374 [Hysterangium stoloniferum]|nr:hypothetical protein BU17DRAFT_71374 [Hysterangium stoloniferum]
MTAARQRSTPTPAFTYALAMQDFVIILAAPLSLMSSVALWQPSNFDFDATSSTRRANPPPEPPPPEAIYVDGVLNWGLDLLPFDNLRWDRTREKEPLKKRVTRWLRAVAKEEGIELEPEEPVPESSDQNGWYVSGDWTEILADCPYIPPDPLANVVTDPRLVAQFRFVERTARARKMTEKEGRRLHIFFRKSTEEKIKQIEELARFLLPLVLMDNEKVESKPVL